MIDLTTMTARKIAESIRPGPDPFYRSLNDLSGNLMET